MTYRLSQGHPLQDANKRTASAALELFVKKNRNGKGLTGNSSFIVGQCADNPPISLADFTIAVGKLIPAANNAKNEPP